MSTLIFKNPGEKSKYVNMASFFFQLYKRRISTGFTSVFLKVYIENKLSSYEKKMDKNNALNVPSNCQFFFIYHIQSMSSIL